jgi:carbonic anhydrase/acetyltransferase-like protein (isoleucine patch superfamily)
MIDHTMSLEDLLKISIEFSRTSSVENIKDRSVTFVKSPEWMERLKGNLENNKKEVMSFCDSMFWGSEEIPEWLKKRARPIFVHDAIEKFILFHNEVNKNRQPATNIFATDCKIHPSVIIGVDGMRFIKRDEKVVSMKHMGNVVLGARVEIGAYSVVHRASLDSTVIGDDTKIGVQCNIGHNVVIGESCFITPMTTVGGSCVIGDNVWIGMRTAIADNIRVCGDVKIGMGSVVVKDITEPGLYYGSPATRKGDWDGTI